MRDLCPSDHGVGPGSRCSRSRRSPAASCTTGTSRRSRPNTARGRRGSIRAFGQASKPAASNACTPTRPRRSRRSTPARTSSSSRRPRRARRSATRCRSSRPSPTTRQSRALFLFPTKALGQDQVAEFSELSRAAGLSIAAATYDGDTPAPDPVRRPEGGPGRRHEPGHAELRDPPPPHEVVPAVRAAPGHRHRRAAHVPRGLRQPRRERHPATAPPVRPLRQHSGDRLLLGDDREPVASSRRC